MLIRMVDRHCVGSTDPVCRRYMKCECTNDVKAENRLSNTSCRRMPINACLRGPDTSERLGRCLGTVSEPFLKNP